MNKNIVKKMIGLFTVGILSASVITGCANSDTTDTDVNETAENTSSPAQQANDSVTATELEVRFGDEGEPFTMHLYDNDTAKEIARDVGTEDWRLPIYHFDDYENWEVMQYYDIPSRYEIPSNPETVTSEKAGEVYYSDPNRIILFYGDAQVKGEYTRVGYFDYSEEFRKAVVNNPELADWGNKIVRIKSID